MIVLEAKEQRLFESVRSDVCDAMLLVVLVLQELKMPLVAHLVHNVTFLDPCMVYEFVLLQLCCVAMNQEVSLWIGYSHLTDKPRCCLEAVASRCGQFAFLHGTGWLGRAAPICSRLSRRLHRRN